MADDTIVAIATAEGRGGVGIVRLSGPGAGAIAERVFRPKQKVVSPWPAQQLIFGEFLDPLGDGVLDDGYAVRMAAPHTYTGEEVVELHAHGSPIVLDRLVASCTHHGGRIASPGEFTRRAFLHGRIDLVQAEAVAELIAAKSEAEAKAARQRLEGKLSANLQLLRELTISLLAECEGAIDFPEEDIPTEVRIETESKILKIQVLASAIRSSYEANQRLTGGFVVVLLGRPNAGKSSIFNRLLETERAIVTSVAGTTRDLLREELILRGRRLRLVDTAGYRFDATDPIEKMGIERAVEEVREADLVLLTCDGEVGWQDAEEEILQHFREKPIWVLWNKMDLATRFPRRKLDLPTFELSALTGEGLESLRASLGEEVVKATLGSSEGGIANDRQRALLDQFLEAMARGKGAWSAKESPELVASELQRAYRALNCLLGKEADMEDVLSEVFSRFCIGK